MDMDAKPTLKITGSTDEINLNETAPSSSSSFSSSTVPSLALLQTQKIRGHIQFMALCWTLFLLGWNDGCIGPLLPRIKEVYHVGHRGPLIMIYFII